MSEIEHLRCCTASAVQDVCRRIKSDNVQNFGVHLELQAFAETCTVHDGRRLANALRHVIDRPDLSLMVSALVGDCPHCGAPDAGNCRMPVCQWTN